MTKTNKILLIATIIVGFTLACVTYCHGQSATPSWTIDGVSIDLSQVTEADIAATITHRNALHEQLIQETLPAASQDVKDAVSKAQILQKDIDSIALQAAQVPILEKKLAQKDFAIWRNAVLGLVLGAILALVGPKLLALTAI